MLSLSKKVATLSCGAVLAVVASVLCQVLYHFLYRYIENGGCPLFMDWEGREHVSRSRSGIMKVLEAADMSKAKFADLVGQGEPFVVRHAFDEWPAMQQITNCSQLAELYPELLYHDWQGGVQEQLGNIADWSCRAGYLEKGDGEWAGNTKSFQRWLSGMKMPGFMNSEAESVDEGEPSMSVFIGMPFTGVTPHLDENCESFVSVQFSGRKRWTVSWPERSPETGELRWSDPLAVVLERGDAIFWYMSQMHHTEVLDGCSVSSSLQFKTPAPVHFHRRLKEMYADSATDWRELYRHARAYNDTYFQACSVVEGPGNSWTVQTLFEPSTS